MKLIKREYLTKLIDVMNTPDIKVITGVRRSGKSKLLEMFKEYIVKNVGNNNGSSESFRKMVKYERG